MRNKVLNGIVMGAVMLGLAMPAFAAVVKKPPKGNSYTGTSDSTVAAVVKKPPKSK